MDYYTILRMLRNFDETKTTFGRTKNWEQKNIIGYFGYEHANTYVQFLIQLGANELYSYYNPVAYPYVEITQDCKLTINRLIQQPINPST